MVNEPVIMFSSVSATTLKVYQQETPTAKGRALEESREADVDRMMDDIDGNH